VAAIDHAFDAVRVDTVCQYIPDGTVVSEADDLFAPVQPKGISGGTVLLAQQSVTIFGRPIAVTRTNQDFITAIGNKNLGREIWTTIALTPKVQLHLRFRDVGTTMAEWVSAYQSVEKLILSSVRRVDGGPLPDAAAIGDECKRFAK
jgi:hypothetical protein